MTYAEIQQAIATVIVPKKYRFGICKFNSEWVIWDTKKQFEEFIFFNCEDAVDLWTRLCAAGENTEAVIYNQYNDEDRCNYFEYCVG